LSVEPILQSVLQRQIVDAGIAFLQVLPKRESSKKRRESANQFMIRLRDSLSYRAVALPWHGNMAQLLENDINQRMDAVRQRSNKWYDLLQEGTDWQHFIFDDQVFNAVALFDYAGGFAGFTLHGERRWKMKWDRLQKYARDGDTEGRENGGTVRVAGSEVGKTCLVAHEELLRKLSDYRHEVIHSQALTGSGSVTTRFTKAADGSFDRRVEFRTTVPAPFAKRFTVPGFEAEPQKATTVAAAKWLSDESRRRLYNLMVSLSRTLRTEAGIDPNGPERFVLRMP
jgi:hypothetical protein